MAEHIDWKSIRVKAGPFPPQAYQFVREGLAHTVRSQHAQGGEEGMLEGGREDRHVTGQQLCLGLRDYATQKYGRLARTVLSSWHVHQTDDFGKMVFAMIDAGLMRKTDEDAPEDFANVYDFGEAFGDLAPPVGGREQQN